MNAIPILLIVIILLLLYIILFVHGKKTTKNSPNSVAEKPIPSEKPSSVIGKTKTVFPSQGTERKHKEADENRTEKPLTFAPESPSEDNENEFNPMAEETEIDTDEVEKEDLTLLLDKDIEVSDESLTAKEIRRIQQAVKRGRVSEEEKPELQKTVSKLQGSDFLTKLQEHEALQSQISNQLTQILAKKSDATPKSAEKTDPPNEDWTAFL